MLHIDLRRALVAAGALLIYSSGSWAQEDLTFEQDLASRIHQTHQMEMEMARLAASNAAEPKIRAYGERLLRDHQVADKRIVAYANDRKLTLTTSEPALDADREHAQHEHAVLEKLRAMKGAEF